MNRQNVLQQLILCVIFTNQVIGQFNALSSSSVFSPIVTATCRQGMMTVKVESLDNFLGVVQSRDYRKPECSGYGENTRITYLRINMMAQAEDKEYCGVFISEKSEEYSVAVAVRLHKTLELAGDKFYMITCGKAGFQNSRNETSLVNLEVIRGQDKVQQVIYGQEYKLRAYFSQSDGKFGMKVKRCFSFSDTNNTVQLVDDNGCPDPNILSPFTYNPIRGTAEATLYSMFKFPESKRAHFQCDIAICRGRCPDSDCEKNGTDARPLPQARSLEPKADALLQPSEDGALMASYSVFVLEPGEQVDVNTVCSGCDMTKSFVKYLCIAFGILFLVMLLVNVYLCCAITGSAKICCFPGSDTKDKSFDKRGSSNKPDEFDPYARSWHGSQYGSRYQLNSMGRRPNHNQQHHHFHDPSAQANTIYTSSASLRYSLNGQVKAMPVPYIPTDTRVLSTANGAVVGQLQNQIMDIGRPDSRYSNRSRDRRSRSRSRHRSRSKHRRHTAGVQSSSSGQSGSTQFSTSNSTGRLVTNGHPRLL